jgi:hypothetical protein
MIKSIALGLLAGCAVVIVLASLRTPTLKPVAVTTSGVVRFSTTLPTSSPSMEVRLYRIDDLILRLANREIEIIRRVAPATQRGANLESLSKAEIVDAVIKLIEDTIDSDNWKDNGGAIGSIRELSGILIIQNTPEALDKIESLLDELRRRTK